MPPSPENNPKNEPVGPLVGAMIVVALIIVGGVYFWSQRIDRLNIPNPIPVIIGGNSSTTELQ